MVCTYNGIVSSSKWKGILTYATGWMNLKDIVSRQSCPSLCYSMDCSPQAPLSMRFSRQEYWLLLFSHLLLSGSWVAIPFSRGSSRSRDWTWVSCIPGKFFTVWAAREAKWNKSATKRQIVYDSISMGVPRVVRFTVIESRIVVARDWGGDGYY